MTATTIAIGPMSEVEHQSALRRAVIASTVGTTIEWYDFLIYSTVTGLVFNKVYFPGSDPWVGTLQAFGVYRSASTSASARRSASARPYYSPTKPIRTSRTRCTTAMLERP